MSDGGTIKKVMAAGFICYRVHPQLKKITVAAGPGSWKTHGTYPSEAATWREWKQIMQDPKNISV